MDDVHQDNIGDVKNTENDAESVDVDDDDINTNRPPCVVGTPTHGRFKKLTPASPASTPSAGGILKRRLSRFANPTKNAISSNFQHGQQSDSPAQRLEDRFVSSAPSPASSVSVSILC